MQLDRWWILVLEVLCVQKLQAYEVSAKTTMNPIRAFDTQGSYPFVKSIHLVHTMTRTHVSWIIWAAVSHAEN